MNSPLLLEISGFPHLHLSLFSTEGGCEVGGCRASRGKLPEGISVWPRVHETDIWDIRPVADPDVSWGSAPA